MKQNTVLINNEQYVPKNRKKGRMIKAAAFCVGLFVLMGVMVSGLFMLSNSHNRMKNELGGVYQRSFYELEDAVTSLEISLSKLLASNSDSQSAVLASEVYKNASAASDALTRLPLAHDEIADAEKYLNQVADFSLSFIKNMSYGRDSVSYREKIEELYTATRSVGELVGRESLLISENGNSFMKANKNRKTRSFDYDSGEAEDNGGANETKSPGMTYPEMIYDGPFSDSTSERCYKALEGLDNISYEDASKKVLEAIPYKVESMSLAGETEGKAPAYQILAKTNVGEVSALVSKQGGVFLSVDLNIPTNKVNVSREAANALAKEYAERFGYEVEPIWYNAIGGIATVNLAPVENGVVYYTDLVKIKLSLSDGAFMGLEGTGYCMNHTKRAPRVGSMVTTNGARSLVSSRLEVSSSRLVVIPDGNEKEVLAYEIVANYKDLEYYIYIDAETGKEINILRVVDEAQGKVTY